MRSRYLLLALLLGVGLTLVASLPSPAVENADKENIARLIDQLGSGVFTERQKATKELAAIGAPALEALRKAAESEDAEVRVRADQLVHKIEKEATSARLLAPKRLHLVYKDTPVPEAVDDFQKKSGYSIYLHDPEGKLKERTITLDTDETTFWRAYEMFCAKAGLTEATMQDVIQAPPPAGGAPGGAPAPLPAERKPVNGLPKDATPPPPLPAPPAEKKPGRAAQAAETPPARPAVKPLPPQPAPPAAAGRAVGGAAVPFLPRQLMLKDGKAKKLPTDDRSAVRVRALPKADMFGDAPEGEILLALEATPEPKLQWQGFRSIRIDKALDDKDQNLTQVTPQVPAGPPGIPGAAVPPAPARPAIARPMIAVWGGTIQPIAVQLKKGEKASQSLQELKGVITAQMLSEAQPMITADNLAKAAGKTFKGEEGGYIKILTVKLEEKRTTIQLEFEQPADTVPAMPQAAMPAAGVPARPPRAPVKPLPAPAAQPPAVPAAPPPAGQVPAGKPQVAQVQVQVQGGGAAVGGAVFGGPFNGLRVQDDKGNILPVQVGAIQSTAKQVGRSTVYTITYTFICQPGKDQGQPAKVVYLGRKRVTVDVPFHLKEVPLP